MPANVSFVRCEDSATTAAPPVASDKEPMCPITVPSLMLATGTASSASTSPLSRKLPRFTRSSCFISLNRRWQSFIPRPGMRADTSLQRTRLCVSSCCGDAGHACIASSSIVSSLLDHWLKARLTPEEDAFTSAVRAHVSLGVPTCTPLETCRGGRAAPATTA